MKKLIILLYSALLLCATVNAAPKPVNYALQVKPAFFSLDMVMLHDVVNPPAAARYYAYCGMAAYNIVTAYSGDTSLKPLHSFIRSYTDAQVPFPPGLSDYRIAAVYAILETGRLLLPSGFMLEEDQHKYIATLKAAGVNDTVINASIKVAQYMALKIVDYSKKDNYNKLSTYVRYTPRKGDSLWYPTPPAYMEAVEPHWQIVRPLVLDSSSEFIPTRPVYFSKDTFSAFYTLAKEVYDVSKKLTKEQSDIANFWDCNPFNVVTSGHMMIGFKKISPGGHWMGIAGIAAEKARLNFDKTVMLHTTVSIALMDAFISCWDEKYRSNRIRPETYITRYIDHNWQPVLQTPPFPENTSGHSVISTAAAEVLTYFLGDNFSYTDDTEKMFGLPARKFTSFRKAAVEAGISRFYGGIHFSDSIISGQVEGKQVGQKVVKALQLAGMQPLTRQAK